MGNSCPRRLHIQGNTRCEAGTVGVFRSVTAPRNTQVLLVSVARTCHYIGTSASSVQNRIAHHVARWVDDHVNVIIVGADWDFHTGCLSDTESDVTDFSSCSSGWSTAPSEELEDLELVD